MHACAKLCAKFFPRERSSNKSEKFSYRLRDGMERVENATKEGNLFPVRSYKPFSIDGAHMA